jgi:RNA polymerase sigma factor (sigma-70 family)
MPEHTDAKGKEDLEVLFDKAMTGDRQARQDLITYWLPSILYVIRHKRTSRTRSTYDSDDFTQLVRIKIDQFNFEDKHFASWDVFLSYVCKVAFNEVGQVERKVRRRPKQQSLPLDDPQLLDPGSSPLVQQAAEDEWRRAVASLATPCQRNIARLLRRGFPAAEIAKAMEVTERTIRRVVADLEQFLGGGGGDDSPRHANPVSESVLALYFLDCRR